MPKRVKISGRSSTITNSFAQAIIPELRPSESEVHEALGILGIDPDSPKCSYCGDPATEWDHLRPLVQNQRPTGFFSEIGNLVPACGKCNQSKGNKPWQDWMTSGASLSPATRGVADLEQRIERLKAFEQWKPRTPLDPEQLVDKALWDAYWSKWSESLETLREGQDLANQLRAQILASASDRL